MSNLTVLPLEDNFSTTLSQTLDTSSTTMYVTSTPNFTFGSNSSFVVLNPGKTNMEIVTITSYDSNAGTITIGARNQSKGASVTSTAQSHSVWSKVIISDNYAFWAAIQTAVNSKIDNDADTTWSAATDYAGLVVKELTTTQRDALTPSNGSIIYNTTAGEFQIRQGGAWSTMASGSTQPNATTTVAGKVELATSGESQAGTNTGGTGASNVVLPSDIAANDQSGRFRFAKSTSGNDTYTITMTPTLTAYTEGMQVWFEADTANTWACTLNIDSLGAIAIKTQDGDDPTDGAIVANTPIQVVYDGTNFVLQQIAKASSAEVVTGTDDVKYVTPSTLASNYVPKSSIILGVADVYAQTASIGTNDPVYAYDASTPEQACFMWKVESWQTNVSQWDLIVDNSGSGDVVVAYVVKQHEVWGSQNGTSNTQTQTATISNTGLVTEITAPAWAHNTFTFEEGDLISICINRNAGDGADTLAWDLKVHGLKITFA